MAVLVNAVVSVLLDATQHAQVVLVTVVVDAQLALVVVPVDARTHVQAVAQVAVVATVMVAMAAKDVVITVRQIARVSVKNAVMLTALVIVVDLADLPALRYAEIAKILVIIHALAIADQSVHPVVTMTVLDHAQVVVQAVAIIAAVVAVRVALAHAKEIAQASVKDALVNSSCNRPYGMRCYK